ncbi:MAG: 3D-(3,5/4)-trihydroxycyclohexane-1,2-dione acylhydrolase (decyclizing) [Candidatus Portiera sp.]|nr:3D-(3,5/4)-trihydroxycyclohexane-1,2-dione acylhydrolase (decyclizing) [Portiera sp.]
MKTIKLTMAQALVRYLCNQYIQVDGKKERLFAGGFGIFGHGNVVGIGQALFESKDKLPTYRAHNEQAMAHSAIAYAKAMRGQRMMFATSSVGPGAANMVTAAALAYVNRLPLLLLPGDVFATRSPDPVLQQAENPADATVSVNDCFRPVSCFWDRITRAEQLLNSLPNAMAVLTDPGRRGPVTLSLPQDVQGHAHDFPMDFFKPQVREIRRLQPDSNELAKAVAILKTAQKPFIVSGGGVLYAGAEDALANFASKHQIPVGETQAGKGALDVQHPMNMGAIGVTGTSSANAMAKDADVVLSIGSRLQDFTTGSRSLFQNKKVQLIQLNTTAHDAVKHRASPLLADSLVGIQTLAKQLGSWSSSASWAQKAKKEQDKWNKISAKVCAYKDPLKLKRKSSDAEVVGMVNSSCDSNTTVVCAAGSLPAELHKHWRSSDSKSYHVEYGFSCMGYEIAGALGVKMAYPKRDVIVTLGDGSYMMMNSELATANMLGVKIILVILDNRGFGCINRLQSGCGGEKFNNLLDHPNTIKEKPSSIDFVMHTRSMGAEAEKLDDLQEMPAALERARASTGCYAIVLNTDNEESTSEGGCWWEVGVPAVSTKSAVKAAYKKQLVGKKTQQF